MQLFFFVKFPISVKLLHVDCTMLNNPKFILYKLVIQYVVLIDKRAKYDAWHWISRSEFTFVFENVPFD